MDWVITSVTYRPGIYDLEHISCDKNVVWQEDRSLKCYKCKKAPPEELLLQVKLLDPYFNAYPYDGDI